MKALSAYLARTKPTWPFWLVVLFGLAHLGAFAGEPSPEPILRLETGSHGAVIRKIALERSGRWLATASIDKTVRLWDLGSGRLERVLRPPQGDGNEGKLNAVAMSPDGEWVATAGWTQAGEDSHCIYLFRRATGELVRRVTRLPAMILDLAWSPDGRFLAAGLAGRAGVRVFRAGDFSLAGQDPEYGDAVHGVDFSTDDRLAVASYDGDVRVYQMGSDGLSRLARKSVSGGKQPISIRFSPDGARLALSYEDSTQLAVLAANDLETVFFPDTSGATHRGWASVAWGADGSLYAGGMHGRARSRAGMYGGSDSFPIRQWPNGGRGAFRDIVAGSSNVMDIRALRAGGVVFGTGDPAWGVVAPSGQRTRLVDGATADLRWNREGFRVSRDGRAVQFGYELRGQSPAHFNVATRALLPGTDNSLNAPVMQAFGLRITDQEFSSEPKLNGTTLVLGQHELFRSLAIEPDRAALVVGANSSLRRFDRSGRELWKRPVPGVAWNVNVSADGALAVAAYGDGTIRWHRLSDGEELLAFFPHADRKRWILWTPSGYFDASPGAEELIGWHVNRGRDQGADFYPASRFFDQYYRPDLISEVLKKAETDKQVLARWGVKEQVRIEAGFRKPPRVAFAAAGNGTEVEQEEVTLRYTLEDQGGGISEVRIFQNGKILPTDTRNLVVAGTGNVQQKELKVRLGEGENIFRIVAISNDRIESEPVTLKLTRTARGANEAPTLHVLAVGINQYKNPALNLNYAEADAQGIIKFFASPATKRLFKDVVVHSILNQQATSANLKRKLDELAQVAGRQDVVLVYLAGHGEVVQNEWYFIPHDLVTPEDERDIQSVGISREYLQEAIQRLPAQKVLMLLDACKSGAAAKGTRGVEDRKAVAQLARSTGTYIVAASQADQFATEFAQLGHGVFTYTLLQGLEGKAGDKKITAEGLITYVKDALPQFTEKYRGTPQYPISWGGGSDFPLVLH